MNGRLAAREMQSVVFEGKPSVGESKAQLDRAIVVDGIAINEMNYNRCASCLARLELKQNTECRKSAMIT